MNNVEMSPWDKVQGSKRLSSLHILLIAYCSRKKVQPTVYGLRCICTFNFSRAESEICRGSWLPVAK